MASVDVTPLSNATRIAQRIAGLLNKAEHAATSGEAEMYSQRAEELLLKYELDRASVHQTLADARHALSTESIIRSELLFSGIYGTVTMSLACVIMNSLNNVRLVEIPDTKNQKKLWVIGFQTDVENATLLVASLRVQCLSALERWWAGVNASILTPMQKFKERREFIYSFGVGAALRIERARLSKVVAATPSTALVLRDRSDALTQFMSQFDLTTNRSTAWLTGSTGAVDAGRDAGLASNTHDTGVHGGRRTIEGAR